MARKAKALNILKDPLQKPKCGDFCDWCGDPDPFFLMYKYLNVAGEHKVSFYQYCNACATVSSRNAQKLSKKQWEVEKVKHRL